MLFTRHFLKVCRKKQETIESYEENSLVKEMQNHISMAIAENAGMDIDSAEATAGSKNLETLCKGYAQLSKAEAERLKVELQIAEANKRQMINWDIIIPKLGGAVVAGIATIFWLCLEQGTPLPMRLVNFVTTLTTPRNL